MSSTSGACSGSAPSPVAVICVRSVWCVFVGCAGVISLPVSCRPLQVERLLTAQQSLPCGWTTVCGGNTGWQTANRDHMASSWKIQPVPLRQAPADLLPPSPAEGPTLWRLPHPQGCHGWLSKLRTAQLERAWFILSGQGAVQGGPAPSLF